jgi:hypothetical protein
MQFNNAFFEELSRSEPVTRLCVDVAEEIAADIRSTGPRDTDAYVDGIGVRVKHQRRSVAVVEGTDPKTLLIESKLGVMARALQRAKRRSRA